MKNIVFLLALSFLLSCYASHAQLAITSSNTSYTIDFETTVTGVNNGSFLGTGFTTNPGNGQLDADAWATTGFSDGSKDFGVNASSGDHARGSSNGGVSSGGVYSFDVGGGNPALAFQGTGGDWTPGTIGLKMTNSSGSSITEMNITYNIYVRNDQDRSNSFNLSYSTNNASYTDVSASNYTSPATSTGTSWIIEARNLNLTNLNIAPGTDFYIQWTGNDAGGSGSRDEFALDDIVITPSGASGGCSEPTAQASNLSFGTVTNNSIQASFSASTADKFLVVQSTSGNLGATPVDGSQYTIGASFGSGTVLQYSNNTVINHTGLNSNTTYYYYIFAANDNCSGGPNYLNNNPLTSSTTTTGGGGGSGYYSSIGSQTCESLKTALHNLIDDHTVVSYNSLWTHYQVTDNHSNDAGNATIVWDMYSDNPTGSENEFTFISEQCGTYQGEGDCYNREHSFPKSWWGGSTSVPQYTDIFVVVPTDGWINGIRSSHPFGEVQGGTETHITNNGSKVGASYISVPGFSGSVFEPIDDYKGDFARGYFYMATRYQDVISSWENNTTESDVVLDGSSFEVFEPWLITMLYDWHTSDPVDIKELERNDAIFGIQGNRNPFIDHPEYVDLIWNCGGPAPDTEAPSSPANLSASNTTETTTDLSWSASTDNVAVVGYDIYQDGSYLASSGNSSYDVTSLEGSTTYNFHVVAFDAAGNISASSNVINITTDSAPLNTELLASYFETGWDGWTDGGSDCARTIGSNSPEGNYAIRIRDNSGTRSAMTSPIIDLSGFNEIDVTFSFKALSMETNEDFWLRFYDGNSWQTIAAYARSIDFQNNNVYTFNATINSSNYNFSSNSQIRFQCDASINNDRVYIDAVVVTGSSTSNMMAPKTDLSSELKTNIDKSETILEVDSAIHDAFANENTFHSIQLYPNPTSDLIYLKLKGTSLLDIDMVIYDVFGKKMDQFSVPALQNRIERNLSQLEVGLYILRYKNSLNKMKTEKIYIVR